MSFSSRQYMSYSTDSHPNPQVPTRTTNMYIQLQTSITYSRHLHATASLHLDKFSLITRSSHHAAETNNQDASLQFISE